MPLDTRTVETFLVTADLLHFTRAARALGMAQPTLSAQMKRLEHDLGTPLFDRVGRNVRLTVAGTVFRAQARKAMRTLEEARQAIVDLEGLKGGVLRVGVTHLLATQLLPRVAVAFGKAHPQVRLHLAKATSEQVEQLLARGTLDLGVTFSPPSHPDTVAERLFVEPLVLALASRHPWARRRKVAFAELGGLPLVLTDGGFATRRLVEKTAAKARVSLDVAMEVNDIDLILVIVKEGGGATVIARRLAAEQPGIVLVPIVEPTLTRTASLLWHRDRYRTAAARVFSKLLSDSAHAFDGRGRAR